MGGSVNMPGNARPGAQANVANDPVAAAVVVHAGWARPPLMVGLDATHVGTLTDVEFALADRAHASRRGTSAEPLEFYRRFGGTFYEPGGVPPARPAGGDGRRPPRAGARPGAAAVAVQDTPGRPGGVVVVDLAGAVLRAGGGRVRPSRVTEGFSPWELGLEVDVDRFRAEVRQLFGGE